MDVPLVCVFLAFLLPYALVAYAKFSTKGYDNSKPREFLESIQGKARRAHHAHLNGFEAFPPFAVAVILAHLAGVGLPLQSPPAVAFIVFRCLYGYFYLIDQPTLRTIVWFGGFFCTMGLFLLAIFH